MRIEFQEDMSRQQLRMLLQKYFCGCGAPDDACGALMRLLATFEGKDPAYVKHDAMVPDQGLQTLLLYFIDHMGLIEHGGGISASWLTPLGKGVIAALRAEEADGWSAMNEPCCIHGFDVDDKTHKCEAVQ